MFLFRSQTIWFFPAPRRKSLAHCICFLDGSGTNLEGSTEADTRRLARTWEARVKPSSWALCRAVRSLEYPTVASSHPLKPKPDLQLIHTNRFLCWVLYFRVWAKGMRLAVSGLCQPSGIMGSRERGSALLRFGLSVCFSATFPRCKCIRVALTLLPASAAFLDIISINK